MATTQPSQRASLLAGLRTGGVRSVSVPHTAGPQGSFIIPQPHAVNYPPFSEEEEIGGVANMMSNSVHISQRYNPPRTAHFDTSALSQQQRAALQGRINPFPNDANPMTAYGNQQEMQLQMMQMELMRLQALSQLQQYTQYRHENQQLMAQADYAHAMNTAYTAQSAQLAVPMTAAIGGKFGRRSSYHQEVFPNEEQNIYGNRRISSTAQFNHGVSQAALKQDPVQTIAPSKSDSAASWRNVSNDPVLTRDNGRRSPFLRRGRPEPLELGAVSAHVPDFGINRETSESSNDSSSTKSDGEQVSSTPTTPVSGNSNGSLSATREEASKKLFQGLGLGRPSIHVTAPSEHTLPVLVGKVVSQPIRQPRGPPASAEELASKNFANRIRKKAIGGLEALLEARERREGTPANEAC